MESYKAALYAFATLSLMVIALVQLSSYALEREYLTTECESDTVYYDKYARF